MEQQAEVSKDCASSDTHDMIAQGEIQMDMTDVDAQSRTHTFLINYHALLRQYGLTWVFNSNPKIAVTHVLTAIKPK